MPALFSDYDPPTTLGFMLEGEFNSDLPITGRDAVASNIESETNMVNCIKTSKCQMTVDWDNNASERQERAATGTSLRLVFSSSFEGLDDMNITQYLTDGTVSSDLNELLSTFSDLQELSERLENNSAVIFTVDVDGTVYSLDESSVQSRLSVTCPSGYAATDGMC
ncbi:hypothetical protein MAR_034555, partial [Mya arenaria]